MSIRFAPRPWMSTTLILAGVYNLLWGLLVIAIPKQTLVWIGIDSLGYPQIWQCVGMIVGVYGIGYLIAARDPFRHWPIVLVGLLGKVFGPIGFLSGLVSGSLPASMGWMILTNDLVWWIPFAVILWSAFRYHQTVETVHSLEFLDDDPVRELKSQTGENLYDLSIDKPQLLVFLRHTGCTFCREAVADLSKQRNAIEEAGAGIVLVHVGEEAKVAEFLKGYGLDDLVRFCDPRCQLYRQFGLEQGNFRQLFGLRVWLRGFRAGIVDRHGIGTIAGNPLQMPGAFVVHCGRFLRGYQHEAASDRPDYLAIIKEALEKAVPVGV